MNLFRHLSLRWKILLSFSLVLALVIIQNLISYRTVDYNLSTANWVKHTQNVLNLSKQALEGLANMETGYRGFLITGKDNFLEPYNIGIKQYKEALEELQIKTSDNPEQVTRWQDLETRATNWQEQVTEPGMELRRRVETSLIDLSDVVDYVKTQEGKKHFDGMRAVFAQANQVEQALLVERLQASEKANQDEKALLIWGTSITVVIGFVISLLLARGIANPVRQIRDIANRIALGDVSHNLTYESRDEVGALAQSFRDMMIYMTTITEASAALGRGDMTIRVTPKSDQDLLSQSFNDSVQGMSEVIEAITQNAQTLSASSHELSTSSQEMASNAEETATQASTVSAASEQVSNNVVTVATGSEELSNSIREVAESANEAARVASSAVQKAEATNTTIAKLGESSNEIGNVIKVITSIAEQTNLLALNATIEAARAGEAGKGFAVVANEVKELAKETAKATEDIGLRIETIQLDSQGAIEAISEISTVINQINELQSNIASAVEQQGMTTDGISQTVAEAAKSTASIVRSIGGVAEAAHSTTSGTDSTQRSASELARMATELQTLVARFKFEAGNAHKVA